MWYDNRPQDTEDGKGVIDKQYNSGLIERTLDDGTKVYFGTELKGDELIDAYTKHAKPSAPNPNILMLDIKPNFVIL